MLKKAILLVIDGMDTVNFTMAHTPVLSGIHGKTAVGVAHTEIPGAGAAITPIAHGMMGTGANVIAHRPGAETPGQSYDYYGMRVETIGDVAREAGYVTIAVGKNEASIVLGGTDNLDHARLERDGLNANDHGAVAREVIECVREMDRGILVANYNGVDIAAHVRDVGQVIKAVEHADALVGRLMDEVDLDETLVVIAADHGTNPYTGNHNTAPTPLCLITNQIRGRVNLGVCHNIEIARTITSALGLRPPNKALGRDLLALAMSENPTDLNYQMELHKQLEALYQNEPPRYTLAEKP